MSQIETSPSVYDIEQRLQEMYEAGQDTSNVMVCLTKAGLAFMQERLQKYRLAGIEGTPALISITKLQTRYGTVRLVEVDERDVTLRDDEFLVVPA